MLSNNVKLLLIILSGVVLFVLPAPAGLTENAWHLLVIFLATVVGAMVNPVPIGMVIMIAMLMSLLTKTLDISQAFSGFSSHIVWLVVLAFFISRAIIKCNLGKRVAYYFISKLGHNVIGLSYGLIFTDLLVAPFIPSATARGGGVVYPVAHALSEQYTTITGGNVDGSFRKFLMQLCFHTNVITSSMFLTAMAGNPLIASLANNININLSITTWALGAFVPGIVLLLILPFVMKALIKPQLSNMKQAPSIAREILRDMGPLSKNEIIVMCVFLMLIVLWVIGAAIKLDATVTALLGFIVLVITGVITWEDAVSEKEAWRTFLWFAGFVMLSKFLSDYGVTSWIGDNIKMLIVDYKAMMAVPLLFIVFFYMHYFFASITVYSSVMYVTFAILIMTFGVQPLVTAFLLAIFANLSACLTHYGITSAPIFFGASGMKVKEWWVSGLVMSFVHILVWTTVGLLWLKILGWI